MNNNIFFVSFFILILGCSRQSRIEINDRNIFIQGDSISEDCSIITSGNNLPDISIVKKNNFYGLINNKNHIILPIEYDTIELPRFANYFFITKNGLTGVVTEKGDLNIPLCYEHIEYEWKHKQRSGDEPTFIVQKNKKLGSIDFHDKVIIPIEYDGISNWVEYGPEAHYVKKGKLFGLIDYYSGNLIIKEIYDGIEVYGNIIEVKKNGFYGIISFDNSIIIPIIYNRIFVEWDCFDPDNDQKKKIYAEKDNEWFEFEANGRLIRANISLNEIKKDCLTNKPDSNEYWYHLKAFMITPHNKIAKK
ncbi:MAG: WG repeat-containing protein [Tenuifilaceae bacterium]